MVLSIKRIGGGGGGLAVAAAASYYEGEAARARADHAKAADEYMRADTSASLARWWSVEGTLAADGSPVMPGQLRERLEGRGPDGSQLVQAAKRNQRIGGWDLTFSAPKAASALYATATAEIRRGIMEDIAASARAGLQALHARGVFETRRGKDGAHREPARGVAAALFPQATARSGDPQLHVHSVLINAGRRQDGTTGALDPQKLYPWKTAAGALFRAELAHRLAQRGIAITEDGQAFSVAGVPPELIKVWSKRRAGILDELDRVRAEIERSGEQARAAATDAGVRQGPLRDTAPPADAEIGGKRLRELKERITQRTRRAKGTVPAEGNLERRWRSEMDGLGLTGEGVWQAAHAAARRHQRPRDSAADAAIGEALERSAVVTERTLRRLIAEAAQTRGGGAAGVNAWYDRLVGSGRLIALQPNPRGERVFSTEETLARERRMLRDALERRGTGGLIRPDAAEAAITARPMLSAEQARAVRHTARGDGVVVVEGVAGSGKSFALAAVVDAANRSGARVVGLAPSWAAADVVRAKTALPGARALQGFVQDLDAGRVRFGPAPAIHRDRHARYLGERVVVLVDEAGMASSRDMAALLAHARQHGAQVVLAGDRQQLRSVEPGAPFTALADTLGVARMEAVRRQKLDWQREATGVFAGGDSVEGLTRYDAKGRVRWARDGEAAVRMVADAWAANRTAHPDASRLVLAARNADVHALNREIRGRLLAGGELGATAIIVRTLHAGGRRGGQGEARDMELREGDRVAIGVTLTRSGRDVLANDLATLEGFTPGRDPTLRLRIDRTGARVVLPVSELAPPARSGQAQRAPLPVLQHAYARTIHKSQAQTVDYVIVHAGAGLDAARAYVALTRQERDVRVVADAGAIAHRLAGNGTLPTQEAIRQSFLRAARADGEGLNAADYVADRATWLRTGDPHALPDTARETRLQAIMRLAAATASRLGQRIRVRYDRIRRVPLPAYLRPTPVRRQGQMPGPGTSAPEAALQAVHAKLPARDTAPGMPRTTAPAAHQKPPVTSQGPARRRGPRLRL